MDSATSTGNEQRDPRPRVRSASAEGALTRLRELEALAAWLQARAPGPPEPEAEVAYRAVHSHLDAARAAIEHLTNAGLLRRLVSNATGAELERASTNLDAAEAFLLSLAPTSYLRGQFPRLLALAQQLRLGDPRRRAVERLASSRDLTATDRATLPSVVQQVGSAAARKRFALRSFRNVLVTMTGLLMLIGVGIALVGWFAPEALPLCFRSATQVVCPTGSQSQGASDITAASNPGDVGVVELIGLAGAGIAAAGALRGVGGVAAPGMTTLLVLLKLPTGALTAFLGLLLIRSGVIPGFGDFDTSADIYFWAVVLGYSQQLFTRSIDHQAQRLASQADGDSGGGASGQQVSAEVLESTVASALRTSIASPRLVNYRGVLSVRLENTAGRVVGSDASGRFSVERGRRYVVRAMVGQEPMPQCRQVAVVIQDGDSAERVPFAIGLVGGPGVTVGDEHVVELAGARDSGAVELAFDLLPQTDDTTIWVRLTQQGALIQLIALDLVSERA